MSKAPAIVRWRFLLGINDPIGRPRGGAHQALMLVELHTGSRVVVVAWPAGCRRVAGWLAGCWLAGWLLATLAVFSIASGSTDVQLLASTY